MANTCVEHDNFYDALEEISSESDSESDGSEVCTSELQHYDFWNGNPKSIDERRDEFIRKTGFVLDRCHTAREGPDDTTCMITEKSNDSTTGKDLAGKKNEEAAIDEEDDDLLWRIKCLNDEVDDEEIPSEVCLNSCVTVNEFQEKFGSSDLVQRFITRESDEEMDMVGKRKQQIKEGNWLKRFSFKAANMFNKDKESKEVFNNCKVSGSKSQRIRVRSHKKWSKELSSLYNKQEFSAHKGSILSMKFSIDGQHLATGGEDGVLNVWKVVEDERITDFDLLRFSAVSAGMNFSVNGIPNLACFLKFKEQGNVMNKLKKSSDQSAANDIMIPRKVFRILEKPLHEFHGHEGEILDISWSKNGHLLSSSVDKTVRLWEVGCSQCLRVFPHNDFVTCGQFNPMDDNYFISGSIDGIVRVWDVLRCQVIDWIDIKEIVTAICYRPDGKGGIVGSMVGNCSFFEISDDFLRHVSVIYLQYKKTLTCKRITGFQFSPINPSEVVVSSADSLVRILKGADIICKLRGSLPLIDRGSQVFASFTADGKHIISATDDSNIYIWNHLNNGRISNNKPKNIWSSESFISDNALIAVPWHGIRTSTSALPPLTPKQTTHTNHDHVSSSTVRSQEDEALQKLRAALVSPAVGDIDYGFLRNVCESILSGSHMWGIVIVTGGKDGQIRTYHNYGLPVRYPGKSLRSSFSNIRNRCRENCRSLGSSASFGR